MKLAVGIYKVRHPDSEVPSFNLSIVKDPWGCIWGWSVFTDKPPGSGKPKMLTHSARNWVEELEVCE